MESKLFVDSSSYIVSCGEEETIVVRMCTICHGWTAYSFGRTHREESGVSYIESDRLFSSCTGDKE